MINNFKKKDTLEVFNDRWKANHNIDKKIERQKQKDMINNAPIGRIDNINNINLINKFKNKIK